jgi:ATP-dependent Clp protease ATP-binding subunit ClpA
MNAVIFRSRKKDRFGMFTTRARSVLACAQEEAVRLDHNRIGTEHILLGLIREGDGIAAKALANLGVELDRARQAVEGILPRGEGAPIGEIRLTPRTKRVLELAVRNARELKHRFVGTEHILLGLMEEGEDGKGVATGALTSLGVSVADVTNEVHLLLAREGIPGDRTASNVVMCRMDDRSLAAIDTLIESGIHSTRSEAAAWLIQAGVEANADLMMTLTGTVVEIRRLQGVARTIAREKISPNDGDSARRKP